MALLQDEINSSDLDQKNIIHMNSLISQYICKRSHYGGRMAVKHFNAHLNIIACSTFKLEDIKMKISINNN